MKPISKRSRVRIKNQIGEYHMNKAGKAGMAVLAVAAAAAVAVTVQEAEQMKQETQTEMAGPEKTAGNNAAVVSGSADSSTGGSSVTAADYTAVVSPEHISKINGGRFEGWGTSLCWWANRIGYSDTLSKQAAADFFGKDGLQLNIVRYNIGGGDDPSHDHITRTDSEMPGYAVNASYDEKSGNCTWDYDWTQDANQRNVLNQALAAYGDDLIVEAFSNSPPYFMTKSGCSSGAVISRQNNLKDDCYDDFARYLADVSAHFKKEWGITFQSIDPMNEPNTDYWKAMSEKQEGCHFDPGDSQSEMLVDMRSALDKEGLTGTILCGTDETDIDKQIVSYNVLTDEAKAALGRIDTHSYIGSKRTQLSALAQKEGKNLWMSEVDGGDTAGVGAVQMGAGLWLAQRITTDMNQMTPSAWILWQAIDSHISKDGYQGKKDSGMVDVNSGYWGLAVADHDKQEVILTMKYYAFGQFTRFIRPGYEIISVDDQTLAAYDPEGHQLVIVTTNADVNDKTADFDLSGFKTVGADAGVTRTSGSAEDGEKWAVLDPVAVQNQSLQVTLKGNSVTTFVIPETMLQ